MIVSQRKRFIFVHVPKSAGTSVRSALKRFRDYDPNAKTRHETISDFLSRHGPEYAEFFQFAFVRNPWDRMVSAYFYTKQKRSEVAEIQSLTFRAFLGEVERNAEWVKNRHSIRPQIDFVTDKQGNQIVNFIGSFENLAHDFAVVCAAVGIRRRLRQKNVSVHKAYTAYYDTWSRDFIAERYRKDIERFGYSFAGPASLIESPCRSERCHPELIENSGAGRSLLRRAYASVFSR